jgi:hypothetical protein
LPYFLGGGNTTSPLSLIDDAVRAAAREPGYSWPLGIRFLGVPFGHAIDGGQVLIAVSGFNRRVEPGGYGLGDC